MSLEYGSRTAAKKTCDLVEGKLCCPWMGRSWDKLPDYCAVCPACGATIIWPSPPPEKELKMKCKNGHEMLDIFGAEGTVDATVYWCPICGMACISYEDTREEKNPPLRVPLKRWHEPTPDPDRQPEKG